MIEAIFASRSSGTSAIAVWPCCTFDGSGFSPVSHSNTVLLPVPANPTRPIFITNLFGEIPNAIKNEASPKPHGGSGCWQTLFLYLVSGLLVRDLLWRSCDFRYSNARMC